MIKKTLLLILCLIVANQAYSQKDIEFSVGFSFFSGLNGSYKAVSDKLTEKYNSNSSSSGQAIKATAHYNINDNIKFGLGLNIEKFNDILLVYDKLPNHVLSAHAMPLYISAEAYPFSKLNKLHFYGNVGYSFMNMVEKSFKNGALVEVGIGYFLPIKKSASNGFKLQLAYSFRSVNDSFTFQDAGVGKVDYSCARSSLAASVFYKF